MKVCSPKTLKQYWTKHSSCEQPLRAWLTEAKKASWKNFAEVKAMYPSASLLRDNRIVFNIKGNAYRLIVKVNFAYGQMWIRFVGTHAEYDKIDANSV
jgi:mRNA interferase HigB